RVQVEDLWQAGPNLRDIIDPWPIRGDGGVPDQSKRGREALGRRHLHLDWSICLVEIGEQRAVDELAQQGLALAGADRAKHARNQIAGDLPPRFELLGLGLDLPLAALFENHS